MCLQYGVYLCWLKVWRGLVWACRLLWASVGLKTGVYLQNAAGLCGLQTGVILHTVLCLGRLAGWCGLVWA